MSRSFVAMAVLSALSSGVLAGPGAWTSNGPDGGSVALLVGSHANANQLYAMSGQFFGSGIFRSSNFGGSWTRSTVGIGGSQVSKIVPHPTIANRVFLLMTKEAETRER